MKVVSCSRQLSKTCRFHESNNLNSQRKSSVARASFHKLVDSNESNEPNFLFLSLHGSEIRSHYIPKVSFSSPPQASSNTTQNEDAHEAWRTSMWSGLPLQKHGKYSTIGANSVFRFPTHPHQTCSSNVSLLITTKFLHFLVLILLGTFGQKTLNFSAVGSGESRNYP
jgi:hypothetical protein